MSIEQPPIVLLTISVSLVFLYVVIQYEIELFWHVIVRWCRFFPRAVFWKPIFSVAVLGLGAASCFYLLFNKDGLVFASTLYASLFFFNETLRSNHPKPTIVEICDDTTPATEDDKVKQDDGTVLFSRITIRNTGYSDIDDFHLKYCIYPTQRNEDWVYTTVDATSLGWQESDDTLGEIEPIKPNDEREFTINVDVVGENIKTAKYFIIVKASPSKRFRYLAHQKIHELTFRDTS